MRSDSYLFRGKRVKNGEWTEGAYASNGGVPRIIYSDYEGFHCEDIVTPRTVGQCTGLKDRNGKLIFEGDIVNCVPKESIFRGKNYLVYWKNGNHQCGFCIAENGIDYALANYVTSDYYVIGNIHDNPELLEVNK